MKKLIKTILIFCILTIPLWVIFDNKLIKLAIIKISEKTTKKETKLERVTIKYIPNLEIELINFKLPNPYQNNDIISAENLKISIDLESLLNKRLIINEIRSNSATLFNSNRSPAPIINQQKNKQNQIALKSSISEKISSLTQQFDPKKLNTTAKNEFDITEEKQEIKSVIDNSTALINEKKEISLKKSTNLLYEINNINIDNINSVKQLNSIQNKLKDIHNDFNDISNNIEEIESIYTHSTEKIGNINELISEKINKSFKFNVSSSQNISEKSILIEPTIKLISYLKNILIKKEIESDTPIFTGETYNFNKKSTPKFLIKKIQINEFESDHYLKGLNITTNKSINEKMKLYIKLTNQKRFEKWILNISSTDKKTYSVNTRFRNININKTKLYEDSNVIVNFQENKRTDIDLKGELAPSSNISIEAMIKQPNYRVINKTAKENLISEFMPYLNNQDLTFNIQLNGNLLTSPKINAKSNLDPLINTIQSTILKEKINKKRKALEKQIKKTKEAELEETQKHFEKFDDDFKKTINQLKFQEKEVMNQKDTIERRINQKKVYIKNNAENEIKNKIKKIKIN